MPLKNVKCKNVLLNLKSEKMKFQIKLLEIEKVIQFPDFIPWERIKELKLISQSNNMKKKNTELSARLLLKSTQRRQTPSQPCRLVPYVSPHQGRREKHHKQLQIKWKKQVQLLEINMCRNKMKGWRRLVKKRNESVRWLSEVMQIYLSVNLFQLLLLSWQNLQNLLRWVA